MTCRLREEKAFLLAYFPMSVGLVTCAKLAPLLWDRSRRKRLGQRYLLRAVAGRSKGELARHSYDISFLGESLGEQAERLPDDQLLGLSDYVFVPRKLTAQWVARRELGGAVCLEYSHPNQELNLQW